MGWVGLGPHFPTCSGLGWVSQLIAWVGSGHIKWTHDNSAFTSVGVATCCQATALCSRVTAATVGSDLFVVGEQEVEVEREGGDEVDDVDGRAEKRQFARADDEPDHDLEREPRVADALDVEERVVRVRPPLVQHPLRRAVRPYLPTCQISVGDDRNSWDFAIARAGV